jgi:transcriptional antiterminator RfaH
MKNSLTKEEGGVERWYLIVTKSRQDERAERNLLNQNFKIFRPKLRCYRNRYGKRVTVDEPLFPRYIFISLDEKFCDWSAVRSTRGITEVVRFNEIPAIVPDKVIEDLKNQVDEYGVVDKMKSWVASYRKGDHVEIQGGSFHGLRAVVEMQASEERVILLLSLLGRAQPLSFSVEQVRRL